MTTVTMDDDVVVYCAIPQSYLLVTGTTDQL